MDPRIDLIGLTSRMAFNVIKEKLIDPGRPSWLRSHRHRNISPMSG